MRSLMHYPDMKRERRCANENDQETTIEDH